MLEQHRRVNEAGINGSNKDFVTTDDEGESRELDVDFIEHLGPDFLQSIHTYVISVFHF